MNLLLIGFMGVGKSTVAEKLAQTLAMPLIDLDALIEQRIGMPIKDYFEKFGETAFRQVETAVLQENLTIEAVIATGGGVVLKAFNRKLLQKHPRVVYLTASDQHIVQRLHNDQRNVRPLILEKTPEEILAIAKERESYYQEAATIVVDTSDKTPEAIVAEIKERLSLV